MTEACIIGWAHSPFGKLDDPDIESLIGRVAGAAIADAGIEAHEIDGSFVSLFNNGFSAQDFPSSLVLQHVPELRFKPITRFENACASGSAAVYGARDFLLAGRGRFALVIGVEKMTATPGKEVGDILLKASYQKEEADIPAGFAGVFGRIAEKYFQRYGDQSDALAAIAAKNHKNGVDNPYAQMRKDLGYDFCRTVSRKEPVCRAAAEAHRLLAGVGRRRRADHGRRGYRARHGQGGALQGRRAGQRFPADQQARHHRVRRRGARPGARRWPRRTPKLTDLSFVESHDCFTIAELLEYEAMGLTAPGQGARAVLEGWTREGRQAAGESVGRAEGEGPPDRRHRRVDARHHRDAAYRAGTRRDAVAEGGSRRGVQHGRRGGGQLRFDPGAAALIPTELIPTSNLAHLLIQTARRFPDRPAIDLARPHLDLGGVPRPGAGGRGGAGGARGAAWRPGAVARAQFATPCWRPCSRPGCSARSGCRPISA